MKYFYSFILFIGLSLFIPLLAKAQVPSWKILPEQSSLSFTTTQNNAPITGEFKNFQGDIYFDPEQLKESHIKVTVDMASVATPYRDLATTLLTPDWFNTKNYPSAIFTATDFKKKANNTFEAAGELTLKNKTNPVILTFSLEEYSKTKAQVKGSTFIQRTSFEVGEGEWAKTDSVKDEVQIHFSLTATRK